MKTKSITLIGLIVVLALVLGACAPAATPTPDGRSGRNCCAS